MLKRFSMLAALVASCLTSLSAQDIPTAVRKLDSARVGVRRYCNTNKPVGYLCPIDSVLLAQVSAILRPALAADTGQFTIVRALVGRTTPVTSTPLAFKFYEDSFRVQAKAQWDACGPLWSCGNTISEYERGATYYVWWVRTGDTTYRNHAHQLAVNYRDNYLIPNQYGTSPHFAQPETMYLDCLIANDKASCDAVGGVAEKLNWIYGYLTNVGNPDLDHRIHARVIMSLWMAERLAGKGTIWSARLDSAIAQTLSTLGPGGYANLLGTCGASLNYMGGMLYDVLTRIHDQRPGLYNAAIEKFTLAFGTYAWTTQWRPLNQSFNYLSAFDPACPKAGSPTSAPDLNGFMLPLFGWLGKQTGDTTWFTRGDQVLAGMQNASFYLYRQFSESYSSSFRYLGYRYAP